MTPKGRGTQDSGIAWKHKRTVGKPVYAEKLSFGKSKVNLVR